MQALAEEAGMKTSAFILREVLGEDCRMALTGEEQRALHDSAVRLASLGDELAGRGTVALLFEARLDEMARKGRGKEMEALLASVTGPERAAGIARRAAMRAGGGETGGAG